MSSALAPGIYPMPEEQYYADPCEAPSLSNSIIKHLIGNSPRHAWMAHPRLNPDHAAEESKTFDFGTAAHAAVLEGRDVCVVVDAADWRTKAAQTARDDARAAGKVPLLPPQYASLKALEAAARGHLKAAGLQTVIEAGEAEQTLLWKDGEAWCRGRLDILSKDRRVVLDYKTTNAGNPEKWMRGMLDMGYDTQAAFYPRGLRKLGFAGARFIFLVQETAAPYCCYVVEAAESMAQLARMKVERAINLWTHCVSTNAWPGYRPDVYVAEAPPWALINEGITE